MPKTITTAGGLHILVEELPHTHSVSLGAFVGVGAGCESSEFSGASHFIEHLCFKGTQRYPDPQVLSLAIEGVGGILNASTGYESTVYWAKVANIHFDRAINVLTDLLCYPLFDPRDIEKERRVIIEEIRGLQDTPSEWVHNLLQAAMWGDQPLGRDIAGSVESVSALNREQLLDYWQHYYRISNMVLSVAGNVQVDRVVDAIQQAFGDVIPAHAAYAPVGQHVSAHPGACVTMLRKDTEQGNFCLGFPAFSYKDPDRRALQVLDTIMGGGMSSRLFQTLREDLGLAYSVGSYQTELADTGMWVIYGSVDADMLPDTISATMDILHDLLQTGATDEEIDLVKEQVKGGILLSLEDTWSVASRNGSHQLRYAEVIPVEQVVAEIEAVTHADVQRVTQRVIQAVGLHLAVIGPYDDGDEQQLQAIVEQVR